jgi:HSP20 family protein
MKTDVPVTRKGDKGLPTTTRWADPLAALRDLETTFDAFWTRPFLFRNPAWTAPMEGDAPWMPVIDVFEKGTDLVVQAELPGMQKKDVKVFLDQGMLTIEGDRQADKSIEKDGWKKVERVRGTFRRRIPLAFEPDTTKIHARYEDGVLEVKIPMPKEVRHHPENVPIE